MSSHHLSNLSLCAGVVYFCGVTLLSQWDSPSYSLCVLLFLLLWMGVCMCCLSGANLCVREG